MADPTPISGLVVVDKPAGLTSNQVVGRVKRALGTKKVGHGGTLDPMATGVLLVGVGRATRLLGYLAGHDKRYLATIRLGQATTTDDAEGEPVGAVRPAAQLTEPELEAALAQFRGTIEQVPSSVSAIKVNGRRAYALVRAGQEVQLKAREVHITRLELAGIRSVREYCDLDVDVECSSGTYIRAIARDLGASLGVGGHLRTLQRTRVGPFELSEAVQLDALTPAALIDMAAVARRCFPVCEVDQQQACDVSHGRPLGVSVPAAPTGIIGPDGRLLALYAPAPQVGTSVAVAVFA